MKDIVLVDMDNVLVDFQSGIDRLSEETKLEYEERLDEVPGIFKLMEPMKDAIETYHWLGENFDTYILSTAPWGNPSAWTDKLNWVKQYLHEPAYKRLILSHHKNLVVGDYLIDDRTARGVDKFQGTHIHFGTDEFKDWIAVREYLQKEISK
ncbi:MAG: hypothetical protein HUJ22_12895 [Gracilimonas sp.]|uniref:5' nucleotidase, NT5C type n=1 Tax=Gracilimonas sp. TaxID=1974203 RepID=UPI00199B671B|nr:hypothetical protein [Gracilimonas sp.]MBD3617459.1 hypothetical protein [Gracilimonas sp.]